MNKKTEKRKSPVNVRALFQEYQENETRLNEISNTCETENRERTDAEDAEFTRLNRENDGIYRRLRTAAVEQMAQNPDIVGETNRMIRENIESGRQTKFLLTRDLMMVSDATSGGLVPLQIMDIVRPLEEGLIYDRLGLPMPTGLAGDFVWPVFEAVDAQVAGEGVALSDTKIPFSKLTAQPERIGCAIPVTRESINQSNGILEMIVKEVLPHSLARLINKIVCSTEKVSGATNLVGPFVGKASSAVSVSATPTAQELNTLKAKVLETGIDGEALCWVMTKSMEAILEVTPVNSNGVYIPMVQNHMMLGLPVFTTNEVRTTKTTGTGDNAVTTVTEYIGLGDFRYQPMGLFGDINFVIDPYSQARKNAVDFVINANYGTKTLRPEAFALAKVAAS